MAEERVDAGHGASGDHFGAAPARRLIYLLVADDGDYAQLCAALDDRGAEVIRLESVDALAGAVDDAGAGVLLLDRPARDPMPRRRLPDCGVRLAVITFVARGDVVRAVAAVRAGAFDAIEKPPDPATLNAAVAAGFAALDRAAAERRTADDARARIATLSEREHDVLRKLMDGGSNKEIARALALSPRTIEIHRARLMAKLRATNLPDVFRVALAAGLVARGRG